MSALMWPDNNADLPVEIQAAFGADITADPSTYVWTDLSDRLLDESIAISRTGRTKGGVTLPSASTCTIPLLNADGALTPLRSMSTYWPNVEIGTPVRARLRRAEDSFTRTTSNGLGTSASGQVWTPVSGASSAWSTNGAAARCSITTVNSLRRILLGATLLDAEQRITVTPATAATGAPVQWRHVFRFQDVNNLYAAGCQFDINAGSGLTARAVIRKTFGGVQTDIASAVVSGLLYVPGQPVHIQAGISGQRIGVKVWAGSLSAEPVGWQAEVDDDDITVPGPVGQEAVLVFGNTNPAPYLFTADNYALWVNPFEGNADQWVTSILPGVDEDISIVEVTASGVLRRLTQGATPLHSPIYRHLQRYAPTGHWPLEDGSNATVAASAIPGGTPATATKVSFAADSSLPGAQTTARLETGSVIAGTAITGPTTGTWTAVLFFRLAIPPSGVTPLLTIAATGTVTRWEIYCDASNYRFEGYNPAGTLVTSQFVPFLDVPPDEWVALQFGVSQFGGSVDVSATWYHVTATDFPVAGAGNTYTGTAGAPTGFQVIASTGTVSANYSSIFLTQEDVPFFTFDFAAAANGFAGESATDRLTRLCAEEGVRITVAEPAEPRPTLMGPQQAKTFVDLIEECAEADSGILTERGYGLNYVPRPLRYNPPVALTIDLATYQATASDLDRVLNPTYDDTDITNEWTVSRIGGSSVVARDPISQRRGVYKDTADLNLFDDGSLPNQASWRKHLTTVVQLRDDVIPIDLAGSPDLIDPWLCSSIGSRIRRVNPPAQHPGVIDRLIEGYTVTLGKQAWSARVTSLPADSWDVAVSGGPTRSRAIGSTLGAGGLSASGTSFLITSTATNQPWTTRAGAFPLDVRVGGKNGVGGERITLSGITGASSPQTATVATGGRGGNGVQRAWAAGAEVDIWQPAVSAL